MTDKLEMPLEQFAEVVARDHERLRVELTAKNAQLFNHREMIERLTSGPGGIMEMKQTIADKEAEIERLQDIVTRMARIYKHLNPENHPGVYFIHGSIGSYDDNGMPEKLMVVPAYGCDFSYIYERTEKTTGPEW